MTPRIIRVVSNDEEWPIIRPKRSRRTNNSRLDTLSWLYPPTFGIETDGPAERKDATSSAAN